jgi:hypothetical protein
MGFYSDVVLPKLCHLAMRNKRLVPIASERSAQPRDECSKSVPVRA